MVLFLLEKPNILQKSCGVATARFLKYVWSFFNIIHERVNFPVVKFLQEFNNNVKREKSYGHMPVPSQR